MGLFDAMKKSKEINKKAEWKQGLNNTVVELNEDHIKLYNSATSTIIFYRDLVSVDQTVNIVNIRTKAKTFPLTSRKLRGGTEKAIELQEKLIEKISENG